MNSLAIVVPYRDRQAHLSEFLPAFAEHAAKRPANVPQGTVIKIIEQTAGGDFNRGKLKNVGYVLSKDQADCVCFHDVDYCPVRVDYRAPSAGFWAHLSYQTSGQTIDPRGLYVSHGIGLPVGVVLFAQREFEQINGFANSYWGWGYEDTDLQARCGMVGLALDRRHGRFRLLPHINEGFDQSAGGSFVKSAASIKNKALVEARFPPLDINLPIDERVELSAIKTDGLSSLTFSVVSRDRLPDAGRFSVEKITVAIWSEQAKMSAIGT